MEFEPVYTSLAIKGVGVVSYLRLGREVEMQVKNQMPQMRVFIERQGVRAAMERACETECEHHAAAFQMMMDGLLTSKLSPRGDDLDLQWSDTTKMSRPWEMVGDEVVMPKKRYKTDVAFTLPRDGYADILIATSVLLELNGTRQQALELLYRHLAEQVEARRNVN